MKNRPSSSRASITGLALSADPTGGPLRGLFRLVARVAAAAAFSVALAATPAACAQNAPGDDDPRPRAPELNPDPAVAGPDGRGAWLNTDRPLKLHEDLKGHVVVLDFWTYCCINCIHVLPDLEFLEEKYKDQPFVVVGVHSAKFDSEGERASIRHAVQRYDIKHPVVVDTGFRIWRSYGVRSWPTVVVIDAEGKVVGAAPGEGNRELLDEIVGELLETARLGGTLAEKKADIRPDAPHASTGGLRYPGKVLALPPADVNAAGGARASWLGEGALFIADSSNDRVLVTTWPDDEGRTSVREVYGTGQRGSADGGPFGSPAAATFHDPQGLALDAASGLLYVADTKNHTVRTIDLNARTVSTLAGTGEQGRDRRGGKRGTEQALNSPWALALSADKQELFVAMAGPHQLWSIKLGTGEARVIAGSGRENILDGPAFAAALAQPSDLALSSDGGTLYFADTEGSAVRAYDVASGVVRTVIGRVATSEADNALFDFGDVDGGFSEARLQKAVGLALWPAGAPGNATGHDLLLTADTYNDKIKLIDPEANTSATWLGVTRRAAADSDAARFAEPQGVSFAAVGESGVAFIADTNNHRVVRVRVGDRAWKELVIEGVPRVGVASGAAGEGSAAGTAAGGAAIDVFVPEAQWLAARAKPGAQGLRVGATLPAGQKVNHEAPVSVRVVALEGGQPARVLSQRTFMLASGESLPVTADLGGATEGDVLVELSFAHCGENLAVCVPADLAWRVTLDAAAGEDLTATVAAP